MPGLFPYLPIIVLLFAYAFASLAWRLPQLVGAAYLVTSLTCFVAYAIDRSARHQAGSAAWRTPKATLLILGLVGGWPGALLAQQWLRHKIAGRAFQHWFRLTVALNLAGFAWLAWRAGPG